MGMLALVAGAAFPAGAAPDPVGGFGVGALGSYVFVMA
jgi:hypothetical protein